MKAIILVLGVTALLAVTHVQGESVGVFDEEARVNTTSQRGPLPREEYDCSGKANGNYYHYEDCHKFIMCSNGLAYEFTCSACHIDPDTCPIGLLVFTKETGPGHCEWPYLTQCRTEGGGSGTTAAPTQAPTQPPTQAPTQGPTGPTETPPESGKWCNPRDCTHWGHCQDFYVCNNETNSWDKRSCGSDLYWEPTKNEVQGGQCVAWEDLSDAKKHEYRFENCLACYWKPMGDCVGKYKYQAANLTNPHERVLDCPATTVFDPSVNMCLHCKFAKKLDGRTSCC